MSWLVSPTSSARRAFPLHMCQEGDADAVRKAFRFSALRTGGTYSAFNPAVPQTIERLSAQLNEVARVAVAGVAAIGTGRRQGMAKRKEKCVLVLLGRLRVTGMDDSRAVGPFDSEEAAIRFANSAACDHDGELGMRAVRLLRPDDEQWSDTGSI